MVLRLWSQQLGEWPQCVEVSQWPQENAAIARTPGLAPNVRDAGNGRDTMQLGGGRALS